MGTDLTQVPTSLVAEPSPGNAPDSSAGPPTSATPHLDRKGAAATEPIPDLIAKFAAWLAEKQYVICTEVERGGMFGVVRYDPISERHLGAILSHHKGQPGVSQDLMDFLDELAECDQQICYHQTGNYTELRDRLMQDPEMARKIRYEYYIMESHEDYVPGGYFPVLERADGLLHAFYGVDPQECDRELKELLRQQREANRH